MKDIKPLINWAKENGEDFTLLRLLINVRSYNDKELMGSFHKRNLKHVKNALTNDCL